MYINVYVYVYIHIYIYTYIHIYIYTYRNQLPRPYHTIPYHTIPANQPANQPSQPTNQPPPTQPASHKVRGSVSYLAKVPKNPTHRRECSTVFFHRVLPFFFLRQQMTVNLYEKSKFVIQNVILLQRRCLFI